MGEQMVDNTREQIRYRKSCSTLVRVGYGTIMIGWWRAARYIGLILLKKSLVLQQIRGNDVLSYPGISDTRIILILLAMVTALMSFVALMHLFIGLSAIREGMGKKTIGLYIPLTLLMIIISFARALNKLSVFLSSLDLNDDVLLNLNVDIINNSLVTPTFASVIIELTFMIMLTEQFFAAVRIRWYRRQMKKNQTESQSG